MITIRNAVLTSAVVGFLFSTIAIARLVAPAEIELPPTDIEIAEEKDGWEKVVNGLQCRLLPVEQEVEPSTGDFRDNLVYVIYELRNVSDKEITYLLWNSPVGNGLSGSIFKVVDKDGRVLMYKGIDMDPMPPTAESYLTIKPGQVLAKRVGLPYDFSIPGPYRVTTKPEASQNSLRFYYGDDQNRITANPDNVWTGELPSNEVEIKIVPSKGLWGNPNEYGLAIRLRELQEGPVGLYYADIGNKGYLAWKALASRKLFELEVDGKEYVNAGEIVPPDTELEPGQIMADIAIPLDGSWLAREKPFTPLRFDELAAGKHTLRIGFIAEPVERKHAKPTPLMSNPIEIIIPVPQKGSSLHENPDNPHKTVKPESRQAVKAAALKASTAWGEAVEGVQIRLRGGQTKWKESETGRLVADVRNQGKRNLLASPFLYACELKVDGQWYRCPPDTLELRQRPKPFSTGQQYDNIAIKMDRWWELKSPQNAGRPGEPDPQQLHLAPGKHTIYVAFAMTAANNEPGENVRAVSNPVEIEILPDAIASPDSENAETEQAHNRARVSDLFKALLEGNGPRGMGIVAWINRSKINWEDIPVLLELAESERDLKETRKLPVSLAASYFPMQCIEGMVALWIIEAMRCGEDVPDAQGGWIRWPMTPTCMRDGMSTTASEGSPDIHRDALAAYQKWWQAVQTLPAREAALFDPLDLTDLSFERSRLGKLIFHESVSSEGVVAERIRKDRQDRVVKTVYYELKNPSSMNPPYSVEMLQVQKAVLRHYDEKNNQARIEEIIYPGDEGESSGVMKPATSVVSKLSTILQSRQYDEIRDECTPLLEEIGEREPISFLLEQFQSDDRVRRLSAAFFLELLGDKRGIPVIIKELKDKSYRPTTMTKRDGTEFQAAQVMIDHAYAVRLMGVLGDARALPSLIEATSYKAIDHDVAKSLGQIGDKSAIPALRVMMNAYSDDVRARSSVGYGLAMLGDSEGLEVVIGTLTDLQVPRAIRRRAIEFLADLGNKKAVPHLIVALKDEHQDIRVNAARALGKIGNVSSLPAVEEVLKELLWSGAGPAPEGVQGILWAKRTHWPINEIPQVTATIQNQGIRDLAVYRSPDLCEVSVDGQWYERTGSTGVKSSSFPPGKHYTGVLIPMDRSWRHKTTNQPLKLSKGRHEILVAFTAKPTQEEPGPDVRFVSNSVEIEVHPASNKALVWGEESNGLRSAIEFVPEKESYSIGYLVEIRLHIQNVSDKEIRIARETGHPEYLGKWAVEDSNGGGIRCGLSGGKWHGPGGADRRILGPGQETVFDFDSVGLGNPTGDGFPRCESLARIEKPGSYSFRYNLRFEEKADGDWSGEVETGKREIVIGVVEIEIVADGSPTLYLFPALGLTESGAVHPRTASRRP